MLARAVHSLIVFRYQNCQHFCMQARVTARAALLTTTNILESDRRNYRAWQEALAPGFQPVGTAHGQPTLQSAITTPASTTWTPCHSMCQATVLGKWILRSSLRDSGKG
mmetsp:Transcript_54955/g.117287  ORF Transcript_54955/g.117287 Transcript_54955/m.117287 type:complete len:109 (-) Transcript_54955:1413-1739(-)